ncbi:MAG: leucine-rich repeat domain-containing protein [Cyanobacteriota bacterium]|nr:leucine-rich repeat domain-containing protein [Cyanobacteriota bacterium]
MGRIRMNHPRKLGDRNSILHPQLLSEAELDDLIAELRWEGAMELVLLGPNVVLPASMDFWPHELQNKPELYQLREQVKGLAERLRPLSQLTCLILWGNKIGDAGAAALTSLTQLTTLNLSQCQISDEGAASLVALSELTFLNLGGNRIGDKGVASLAHINKLTSLNIWGNWISDVGTMSLTALPQLTSLHLGNNQIGDAGAAALASLRHLTSLTLAANQIGDKGAALLSALSQLSYLHLGNNQIGDSGASSLAVLPHLTSLFLWENQIGDVGAAALASLTKLVTLNLGSNCVGDSGVAYLATLDQLTDLHLGNYRFGKNKISDAGAAALAALAKLTRLDLAANPVIETIPFITLQRLKALNLMKTKVQDLSPLRPLFEKGLAAKWEDVGFTNGINVYGCPLIHPPPEIVKQGQKAVLNYLREIDDQGEDHIYEAKVLILGDGGAGKTSLLRRLYQPDLPLPEEEESTKGIDIHHHTFDHATGRPFHLNVWDFGGQQIYHATHQFFLTKRSLYILVDDTRTNNQAAQDDGFKYWLEMIEALSDHSPVLIFQNEKAGRSKRLDEEGIKVRFTNVKDVYGGNLDEPQAAEALADAIRFHVQRLPHVGEAVPTRWLAIRSELEERKQQDSYISRREYFEIYGRHLEFNETKALQLSRYLHDLGVFLHFQEDPLLARVVILQNDWATEAVFNVLDDEPTKDRFGYFTRADCQRIWAHSLYGDMHPQTPGPDGEIRALL